MKKLLPSEEKLIGRTIYTDGKLIADETYHRIRWLTSQHLQSIAGMNWRILFQDPEDGRYWELSYPQRHRYGDGPPHLRTISPDEARKVFGV